MRMANFRKPLSRRKFISHSASLAAGSVVVANLAPLFNASAAQTARGFHSDWGKCHDRIWLGAEYWANPLQDWRIADGRLESTFAGPDRNVHLLTQQLGKRKGFFNTVVKIGRVESDKLTGEGSVGFRIGIMGPLQEYRNSLFNGSGLDCGLTGAGRLFIGNVNDVKSEVVDLKRNSIELRLNAQPLASHYQIRLSAHEADSGRLLGEVTRDDIDPKQLVGSIALVCNYNTSGTAASKAKTQNAKPVASGFPIGASAAAKSKRMKIARSARFFFPVTR